MVCDVFVISLSTNDDLPVYVCQDIKAAKRLQMVTFPPRRYLWVTIIEDYSYHFGHIGNRNSLYEPLRLGGGCTNLARRHVVVLSRLDDKADTR